MSDNIYKQIKQLENQNIKLKKLLDATLEVTGQENRKLLELQNESKFLKRTVVELERLKRQLEEELITTATYASNKLEQNDKLVEPQSINLNIESKLKNVADDIQKESVEIQNIKINDNNLAQALKNLEQENQQILEEISLIQNIVKKTNEFSEKQTYLQKQLSNSGNVEPQASVSFTSHEILNKLGSLENLRNQYESQLKNYQSNNALNVPVENAVLELKISSIERKKENLINDLRIILLTSADEISRLHNSTQDDQLRYMLNELDVQKAVLLVNMMNIKESSIGVVKEFNKKAAPESNVKEIKENKVRNNTEEDELTMSKFLVLNCQEQVNIPLNFVSHQTYINKVNDSQRTVETTKNHNQDEQCKKDVTRSKTEINIPTKTASEERLESEIANEKYFLQSIHKHINFNPDSLGVDGKAYLNLTLEFLKEAKMRTKGQAKLNIQATQQLDILKENTKIDEILEDKQITESVNNNQQKIEFKAGCLMENALNKELVNLEQEHFDNLSIVEEENPFDLIAEQKKLLQLKNIEKLKQLSEDQEALEDLQNEHTRLYLEVERLEQEKQQLLYQLRMVNEPEDSNHNPDLGDNSIIEESMLNLPLPLDDATNEMYPTKEQMLGQRIRELELDNERIKKELNLILEQIQNDKNEMEILQQAENLLRDRIYDLQSQKYDKDCVTDTE